MSGDSVELFEVPFHARGRTTSDLLFQARPKDHHDFFPYEDREGSEVAFLHQRVLDDLRVDALRAVPNEIIGILVGRVCQDDLGTFVLVMAACTAAATEYEGTPGAVRISVAGKAALRARAARVWPGFEVVGWWHSHPHGPPRFSHEDFNEQATVGRDHVGIVVAAEAYARRRWAPQEPLGVYLGARGIRLECRGRIAPDTREDARDAPPPRPAPAGAPEIVRALVVATVVILLALVATAWWTQRELRDEPQQALRATDPKQPSHPLVTFAPARGRGSR